MTGVLCTISPQNGLVPGADMVRWNGAFGNPMEVQRYFDRLPAEKRGRHLDMIFRSTRNLAALMEEVLLLGKVEEGRMQFTPAPSCS